MLKCSFAEYFFHKTEKRVKVLELVLCDDDHACDHSGRAFKIAPLEICENLQRKRPENVEFQTYPGDNYYIFS